MDILPEIYLICIDLRTQIENLLSLRVDPQCMAHFFGGRNQLIVIALIPLVFGGSARRFFRARLQGAKRAVAIFLLQFYVFMPVIFKLLTSLPLDI